jgi:hypothetical protein
LLKRFSPRTHNFYRLPADFPRGFSGHFPGVFWAFFGNLLAVTREFFEAVRDFLLPF